MKVYGPGEQPYLTEDSIEAFALYLASVAFCDDKQPCVNYYTIDQLKKLGYAGEDLLPQEAAIQATSDGQKGTVAYLFQPPEAYLLKAFLEQKDMLEKSDGLAKD